MSDNRMISLSDALHAVDALCLNQTVAAKVEDAIRALPAVVPGVKALVWLPFDTAPRDGSRFLARGGGLDAVNICSYNARVGCWDCSDVTLDDTDHEPEGYNRPALWMPLSALALIAKEAAR